MFPIRCWSQIRKTKRKREDEDNLPRLDSENEDEEAGEKNEPNYTFSKDF